MYGLHKALDRWHAAGLLTSEQTDAILRHERERGAGRGWLGRGLTALAVFTISIGVLALVAANWVHLSATLKLGAHFLLNLMAAVTVWWADRRGRPALRDTAVLAFFGLTLTLIALIGQVFQLDGSVAGALTLWLSLATPAVFLYGQGRAVATLWTVALLATIGAALSQWVVAWPRPWAIVGTAAVLLYLPLLLAAAGAASRPQQWRPTFAAIWRWFGLALLAVAASLASLGWYADRGDLLRRAVADTPGTLSATGLHLALIAVATLAIVAIAAWHAWTTRRGTAMPWGMRYALVTSVFAALPWLVPMGPLDVLAAVHFALLWILIAWLAQNADRPRWVAAAVVLVALRVFVVYLELFGSLLSTGLGLIMSGLVLLGLVYGARRLTRRLAGGRA